MSTHKLFWNEGELIAKAGFISWNDGSGNWFHVRMKDVVAFSEKEATEFTLFMSNGDAYEFAYNSHPDMPMTTDGEWADFNGVVDALIGALES